MRAAMEAGHADPEALRHRHASTPFGSCRLCLVEIEGRSGTPASCTTPVDARHDGAHADRPACSSMRRGVMELYISDHPLDCLTCAANGDCELQDMAGAVGLREVRYGYDGDNHVCRATAPTRLDAKDESQPVLHLRPVEVHRLLALRARLRGSAGHLRADDRRPRLRHRRVSPGMDESFLDSECVSCGACVQACPTATLTEKSVIEHRPARALASSRPAPIAASAARSRPRCRATKSCAWCRTRTARPIDGHSCVKGRFAWGYATHKDRITQADDPREDHRSVARSVVGRGHQPTPPSEFRRIQDKYGRDSIGGITSSRCTNEETYPGAEAGARRASATTMSTPAPASATRRPATASKPDVRHVGRHAGLRVGRERRRDPGHRRQPDRRAIRCSPRA